MSKEILLGFFEEDNIVLEKKKSEENYEEKIVSYVDSKTDELVIKFVRKPVNNIQNNLHK